MNAHITKPINVEMMLSTMAEWIARDGPLTEAARPVPPPPPSVPEAPVLDKRAGLTYCMGNEEFYRRLLSGFREAKADFPVAMRAALAAGSMDVAVRRAHDLKGLAGTIGALPLETAAQLLHRLLVGRDPAAAEQLERVIVGLAAVMRRVEEELAAG